MFGKGQVVGVRTVADDTGQVGMGQRVAQEQVRVELARVLRLARHERDHNVGVMALGPDVGLRVALAPVQLLEHLVG